jgi:signal transduction histidine kinase
MMVFNNVSKAKLRYRGQLEEGIEKLKVANNDLINLRSIEKFAASGRIARAIAHEVRNPLTSISLAAEELGSSVTSKEETMLIDIITRNVDRIHHLVLELLNSTKFSQLTLTKQSLNTIVEKALELAKDRIELHGIKVVRNFSVDPCIVVADGDKMITAVLNLLVNAIEAVDEGKGIIEINTGHKSGQCSVTIKDNGVGISGSSLSRIFEPYFTQKENGSGLGLTLTQNIILNHKGNISVESKETVGTIFTILLNHAD